MSNVGEAGTPVKGEALRTRRVVVRCVVGAKGRPTLATAAGCWDSEVLASATAEVDAPLDAGAEHR